MVSEVRRAGPLSPAMAIHARKSIFSRCRTILVPILCRCSGKSVTIEALLYFLAGESIAGEAAPMMDKISATFSHAYVPAMTKWAYDARNVTSLGLLRMPPLYFHSRYRCWLCAGYCILRLLASRRYFYLAAVPHEQSTHTHLMSFLYYLALCFHSL